MLLLYDDLKTIQG